MNRNLNRILADVKKYHRHCKSILLYRAYQRKIDRAIAPEGQKKIATLELAMLMGVKP